MPEYLNYQFEDSEEFINTFDELPLWSSSFGLLLLKHLELKPNLTVIDLGSGAGFPLLELAERLGKSCKLIGIDPWINANRRVKQKILNYKISNVDLIECSAEKMPIDDISVDLIVSNLGINNFKNPQSVFIECNRVLKPGGKLALTTNLNGHWKEFYQIFEQSLTQLNLLDLLEKIIAHQKHRGTIESISKLYTDSDLKVCRHYNESFEMKFLDGTSFLNHHFIKLGWLSSWIELLPTEHVEKIFSTLEENLNAHSKNQGVLSLTVPMAYVEGEKIK